jgi:hypothetical protein
VATFIESYCKAVKFYEDTDGSRELAQVLGSLLGPDPLETQHILAYLLRSEQDAFRAFVVTPRQFIVLEFKPTGEHLISVMALRSVLCVYEFSTANTLTVTIEMDADIIKSSTTGNFASVITPSTPDESPVTRGDLVLDTVIRRATYAISSPRTEEAASALAQLTEFSAHFRAAVG